MHSLTSIYQIYHETSTVFPFYYVLVALFILAFRLVNKNDRMFEEVLLKEKGVDAEFVGHPIIENVRTTMTRDEAMKEFSLDSTRKTPSSIHHESW